MVWPNIPLHRCSDVRQLAVHSRVVAQSSPNRVVDRNRVTPGLGGTLSISHNLSWVVLAHIFRIPGVYVQSNLSLVMHHYLSVSTSLKAVRLARCFPVVPRHVVQKSGGDVWFPGLPVVPSCCAVPKGGDLCWRLRGTDQIR